MRAHHNLLVAKKPALERMVAQAYRRWDSNAAKLSRTPVGSPEHDQARIDHAHASWELKRLGVIFRARSVEGAPSGGAVPTDPS